MTKAIVVIGFLVSFSAGLIVGMETRRTTTAAPTTRPSGRGSFITAELNLTPQQQEEMKKIWSDQSSHNWRDQEDHRRQFRKERDEAIAALVPAGEKSKLDDISKKYSEHLATMDREMRDGFQKKVEATNAILTPEQRSKYAEFLRRHQWGGRERETTKRSDAGATTRSSLRP